MEIKTPYGDLIWVNISSGNGLLPVNSKPLQWRHNGHDIVSNHQPYDCLLNRLFRCWSKKTSKLRVTGLCEGIHRRPVNSPHKWPVTLKMFHLMTSSCITWTNVDLPSAWSSGNHLRQCHCHQSLKSVYRLLILKFDSYLRAQWVKHVILSILLL